MSTGPFTPAEDVCLQKALDNYVRMRNLSQSSTIDIIMAHTSRSSPNGVAAADLREFWTIMARSVHMQTQFMVREHVRNCTIQLAGKGNGQRRSTRRFGVQWRCTARVTGARSELSSAAHPRIAVPTGIVIASTNLPAPVFGRIRKRMPCGST